MTNNAAALDNKAYLKAWGIQKNILQRRDSPCTGTQTQRNKGRGDIA